MLLVFVWWKWRCVGGFKEAIRGLVADKGCVQGYAVGRSKTKEVPLLVK